MPEDKREKSWASTDGESKSPTFRTAVKKEKDSDTRDQNRFTPRTLKTTKLADGLNNYRLKSLYGAASQKHDEFPISINTEKLSFASLKHTPPRSLTQSTMLLRRTPYPYYLLSSTTPRI